MGFLGLFSKPASGTNVAKLPSGSFTIDRTGRIVASTLPRAFDEKLTQEIGNIVLEMFLKAQTVNLPLREVFVHYAGLKITARELRGGAMIFLAPLKTG
jgi:K+-transporting ATPase A subunit